MNKEIDNKKLLECTILLVEDDPTLSRMYTKKFSAVGGKVIRAFNGAEALEALEGAEVNIILLDLGMPRMDGKETLKRIRENPATKHIPVIILSNTTIDAGRYGYEDIIEAGIAGVFRKYESSLEGLIEQIATYTCGEGMSLQET